MRLIEILKPPACNQFFLFILGVCLRGINKIRRTIFGYTSPRTFSAKEIERSVNYCLNVVKNWEQALISYSKNSNPFTGKHIIELGPGPDLGTGIIILALGAKSYTAVDKFKLIHKTPIEFYKLLLSRLKHFSDYPSAEKAVDNFQKGNCDEKFCYVWDTCFQLNKLPLKKFDILVSQAVLEHLVNVREVFRILHYQLASDAIMGHEVDLGTHTALIRELDPLNLLRYSETVWNSLKFDGSPNRLRMTDYQKILKEIGFEKIETRQLKVLDKKYVEKLKKHLIKKFRNYPDEDIRTKSFFLLGTK